MNRLRRLLRTLRFRGPAYAFYVVGRVLWPWLVARLLAGDRPRRVVMRLGRTSSRWGPLPAVGGEPPATRTVGRIDNDGRLLAAEEAVPGFDRVEAGEFVDRYRYDLEVVRDGDRVLVRKSYRGDREAYRREATALAALAGLAGVPRLHRADPESLVIEKTLVPGRTLRQLLGEAGARILSRDTENDPELAARPPGERLEAVWARGRERFAVLPPGLLECLEQRLDEIHRAGVTGFSLSFGNVVIDAASGKPAFLDFDAAWTHRRAAGWRFATARDRDRGLWNRIYGRDLLTEAGARTLLRSLGGAYAPLDLGRGLVSRGFWSVDSGSGRWQFLNGPALRGRIEGRRILDLGSHHGAMPLLMLRAGAREVVGIERSAELAGRSRELRRLFEWRDLRPYPLDVRCADMRIVLDEDLGRFDLVTAFCTLYYLPEDDMARVVRRAAEIAPVMVLQAKTDTRAEADEKAHLSSLQFLRALLERNGFPEVGVFGPPGYSRPLLIGRRRESHAAAEEPSA